MVPRADAPAAAAPQEGIVLLELLPAHAGMTRYFEVLVLGWSQRRAAARSTRRLLPTRVVGRVMSGSMEVLESRRWSR